MKCSRLCRQPSSTRHLLRYPGKEFFSSQRLFGRFISSAFPSESWRRFPSSRPRGKFSLLALGSRLCIGAGQARDFHLTYLRITLHLANSDSFIPILVVSTHLLSVGILSLIAVRTIYRSYIALPPSSATRHRQSRRKGHLRTFSLLALLSLAVAAFFGLEFASLSYRVWAVEQGVELPDGFVLPNLKARLTTVDFGQSVW